LIRLALHGLIGPIEVKGVKYPGAVPMTPFKFLSDEELADVLTFVRNAFGNKASPVTAQSVQKVRMTTKDQPSFYLATELQK
jgi:mono/diheme cytochrome c family protein